MPWWLHSAVGLGVVALLVAAAWRLAGALGGPRPVPRLLAAVVLSWLGGQLAALSTALPGAPGIAPTGAAAAVLLAGLVLWRAPATPTEPLDPPERRLLLLVGVGTALLAVLGVQSPAIGFDGLLYHLALPAAWAGDGQLASLPTVATGLPVEAYPVGVEVVVGWLVAVSGATVVAMVLAPLALGVTTIAVWSLTRALGGGEAAAWGAAATSVAALPFLSQGAAIATDLPAAALTASGAALVVGAAVRRSATPAATDARPTVPDPSAPATPDDARRLGALAAGLLLGLVGLLLALGIKTSAACGGLLFLLLAWPARRELRAELRARRWWVAFVVVAGACGGLWMARNLVLHGHPAWPLLASSFGDPVPPLIEPFGARFIDHPREMLRLGGTSYLQLAWPVPLLMLASLAALVRGSRALRATAACGLLGALAWTMAPVTGVTFDAEIAVGTTRYLMPCWVLLAGAGWAAFGRLPRPVVLLAAGAAILAQGILAATYATDLEPLDAVPIEHGATVLQVLTGVAVVTVLSTPVRRPLVAALWERRPPARFAPAVGAAALVVVLVLLLAATPGFWGRHATTIESDRAPEPDEVVLATGGVPAFSLGAYGKPGGRLVEGCPELQAGLAAGRTVAVGPAAPECPLPGTPAMVDGFRVYGPGVR